MFTGIRRVWTAQCRPSAYINTRNVRWVANACDTVARNLTSIVSQTVSTFSYLFPTRSHTKISYILLICQHHYYYHYCRWLHFIVHVRRLHLVFNLFHHTTQKRSPQALSPLLNTHSKRTQYDTKFKCNRETKEQIRSENRLLASSRLHLQFASQTLSLPSDKAVEIYTLHVRTSVC